MKTLTKIYTWVEHTYNKSKTSIWKCKNSKQSLDGVDRMIISMQTWWIRSLNRKNCVFGQFRYSASLFLLRLEVSLRHHHKITKWLVKDNEENTIIFQQPHKHQRHKWHPKKFIEIRAQKLGCRYWTQFIQETTTNSGQICNGASHAAPANDVNDEKATRNTMKINQVWNMNSQQRDIPQPSELLSWLSKLILQLFHRYFLPIIQHLIHLP